MSQQEPTPQGIAWAGMSPADFDRGLTARGHRRDGDDQATMFYVPTPAREAQAPRRQELDGQADLFGGEPS